MWDLTVPGDNDHDFYVVATVNGVERSQVLPVLVHNIDENRLCDLTLGPGPNARSGVALPGGDKDAPGVQDMINEDGDVNG
jgi:hypothetical protein